jgi:hypothetical protein
MLAVSPHNRTGLPNSFAAQRDRASRWIAIGVAATFHAALIGLLLGHAPARGAHGER